MDLPVWREIATRELHWRLQPDGRGHQRNAPALRPGHAHSAVISRIKSPIKGLYHWQERLLPIAAVPTNSPAIL
jgi:hypothetical protein